LRGAVEDVVGVFAGDAIAAGDVPAAERGVPAARSRARRATIGPLATST
jgi:hypothetical protein